MPFDMTIEMEGIVLLALDSQDGSDTELADLGDEDVDASPEQDRLIATDGSLYELSSGNLVKRLDFPCREVAKDR
jgi:hypothetical protein